MTTRMTMMTITRKEMTTIRMMTTTN